MSKRYAITFGEVAILHIGGKEYKSKILKNGFSTEELIEISNKYDNVEYISLTDNLPNEHKENNKAGVLIFRCSDNKVEENYNLPLNKLEADKLYNEQEKVKYDKKYWDNRRQKTLNKRARYNIVFGKKNVKNSDDYKQNSIVAFSSLKFLNKVRNNLKNVLGNKSKKLNAEGNYYFEDKSGIGFHGDSERKIVICMSLGKSTKLRYQWRLPGSSEHTLEPIDINVNHGDVYIMSEKATGNDWRLRSKVRVVHAAGNEKYINK
jgi:alkylated DNA repair dioxygenase AlkB